MSTARGRRSRRGWPPNTDLLVLEVDELRAAGIFDFVAPQASDALPLLKNAAAELFPKLPREGGNFASLKALIKAAISKLPLDYEQQAAHSLFGTNDHTLVKLEVRQERAAAAYPKNVHAVTAVTFRQQSRYERSIVLQVADVVASLRMTDRDELIFSTSERNSFYIGRPTVEAEIRDALSGKCRIVALQGPPGTGKSFLARQISKEITDERSIARIDVSIMDRMKSDIADVLLHFGVDLPAEYLLIRTFRKMLMGAAGPKVTIIENAECYMELDQLIPEKPNGTVLITTRSSIGKLTPATVVRVNSMTHLEAIDLVAHHQPEMAADDASQLVNRLGRVPLAISAVCGLLDNESTLTVSDLLSALSNSVTETLDASDNDPDLTTIYRMILESLNSIEARILKCMIFIPNASLRLILELEAQEGTAVGLGKVKPTVRLRVLKAFRSLDRRSLTDLAGAEQRFRAISDPRIHKFSLYDHSIEIHPLARVIMRELMEPPAESAYVSLVNAFEELDHWQLPTRVSLPLSWLYRAIALPYIFANHDVRFAIDHPRALAYALRAGYQLTHLPQGFFDIAFEACDQLIHGLHITEQQADFEGINYHDQCVLNLWQEISLHLHLDPAHLALTDHQQERVTRWNSADPYWWRTTEFILANDWHKTKVDDTYWGTTNRLVQMIERVLQTQPIQAAQIALGGAFLNFSNEHWEEARNVCEQAIAMLEANIDREFGIDEHIRCLILLRLIDIRRGRLNRLFAHMCRDDGAAERIESYEPSSISTILQFKLVNYEQLRASYFSNWIESGKVEPEPDDLDLISGYDACIKSARKGLPRSPRSLAIAAEHGKYCMLALRDVDIACENMALLVRKADVDGFAFASARCQLAYLKIRASQLGVREELISEVVLRLSALSAHFTRDFAASYWAADAAAAAFLIAAWAGGTTRKGFKELEACATRLAYRVDRVDKVELVSQVHSGVFSPLWLLVK